MKFPSTGIGEALRRAREARGFSMADAQRHTKIRAAYLGALEEERFDLLPARAYAKGFLRSYARFVGLDAETMVAALERHVPSVPVAIIRRTGDVPLRPAVPPSPLRRVMTYALWVLALLGIFLAYVLYTQLRAFISSAPPAVTVTPSPAAGPAADLPPPATHPESVPSPRGAAAAQSQENPQDRVTVVLSANDLSWIRVTADGKRVFEGFMRAGDLRRWTGERELRIRVGNAGGVELTVNGRPLGVLGRPGEVVERPFTPSSGEP